MPLYTPNGLKIRFDEEAIDPVIKPLKDARMFDEILYDIELYMNLPNAMSIFFAVTSAVMTYSWFSILFFGVVGYLVGELIKEIYYDDWLRRIFPQFIGSWIVSTIFILIIIFYSSFAHWGAISILVLIVLLNLTGLADILSIFLTPFRIWLIRKFNVPTTAERLFIQICTLRAQKAGIQLEWEKYGENLKKATTLKQIRNYLAWIERVTIRMRKNMDNN